MVTINRTLVETPYTGPAVTPFTSTELVKTSAPIILSNGNTLDLIYDSGPGRASWSGQILDPTSNPLTSVFGLASSSGWNFDTGMRHFEIFILPEGGFAVSATTGLRSAGGTTAMSFYDNSGTFLSGTSVRWEYTYDRPDDADLFSMENGDFAVRIDDWSFFGADGKAVVTDVPFSMIVTLDDVSVGEGVIAITTIVAGASDGLRVKLVGDGGIVQSDVLIMDAGGANLLDPDVVFIGDKLVVTWEVAGEAGTQGRVYDADGDIIANVSFDGANGPIVELAQSDGGEFLLALFSDGTTKQYALGATVETGGTPGTTYAGTPGSDVLVGTANDDVFLYSGGQDSFDGAAGTDTLNFSSATSGQFISLRDTRADGGTEAAISIEVGVGSAFADVMIGNANADYLFGGGGDDYIYWTPGADVIDGEEGSDTYVLFGRPVNGAPAVQGSTGAFETLADLAGERLSFTHFADASLNPSTIVLQNIENFVGSDSWDTIYGTSADNYLDGASGKDTLYGGTLGLDILTGGTGIDTFVIAPRDYGSAELTTALVNANVTRITDFTIGEDKIDLGGQDGNLPSFGRIQAQGAIDGITDDGNGNAVLQISLGADLNQTNHRVIIEGVSAASLSASDFILPASNPNGSFVINGNTVSGSDENDVIDLSGGSQGYNFVGNGGDDTITGTDFNDSIGGGRTASYFETSSDNGNDTLYGMGGNDILNGDYGDDALYGGSGNDRLFGYGGVDSMYGGDGDDELNFERSDIEGGATIDGGAGYDTLYNRQSFTTEADRAILTLDLGAMSIERYFGSAAEEIIDGRNATADLFIVTNGATASNGFSGWPVVDGATGGDRIYSGMGNDYVSGQSGDVLYLSGASLSQYVFDTVSGGTTITDRTGSDGVDTIIGFFAVNVAGQTYDLNTVRNTFDGTSGNDTIRATGFGDTIRGLDGSDTLIGGSLTDILDGGAGDDYFHIDTTILNNGTVAGGTGYDTLIIDNINSTAASITLTGQTITDVSGIERYFLTNLDDTVILTTMTESLSIYGFAGADNIQTGSGHDYIYFDSADVISGFLDAGAGYNWFLNQDGTGLATLSINMAAIKANGYYGSAGTEIIDGSGQTGSLTIYGNGGADQITGGSGDDYVYVSSGYGSAVGGAGYDYLIYNQFDGTGLIANLWATGFEGAIGRGGNDVFDASGNTVSASLYGAGGNDTLIGGSATDYFYGDGGNDTYTGNGNTDYFLHDLTFGNDTITDFVVGTDIMIVRTAGVASMANMVITQDGADALLTMGANSIRLTGVTAANLTAGDFIFAPTSADVLDDGPDVTSADAKADTSELESFALDDFAVLDDFAALETDDKVYNDDMTAMLRDAITVELPDGILPGQEGEAWVMDIYGTSLL